MMLVTLHCHPHFTALTTSSPSSPLQNKAQICPIIYCSRRNSSFSSSKHFQKTRNHQTTATARRSDFRDGEADPVGESANFFDGNGAVEDMDAYLNYLSLEYDSVWDTKPSWCQPWTITLTGLGIIASSWLILNSIFITSLVAVLICSWWYIFLYSYPKAYSDMIAERRKKVTGGFEDTYGTRTRQ